MSMRTERSQTANVDAPRATARPQARELPHVAEHAERSYVTRALHILLLLTALHQLIGSNFIDRPLPGEDPGWPYLLHIWAGVTGLGFVMMFWLWTLARDAAETPLWRLLPWFSSAARKDLMDDIGDLANRLKALKPPSDHHPALASAVHGLGLLMFTFMAASGAGWYFLFAGGPLGKYVLVLHKLSSNLMIAYVIAHASLAVWHHLMGSDVVKRMFRFHNDVKSQRSSA